MIPFGPYHPDKQGLNAAVCIRATNCLPGVNGFRPLKALAAGTNTLGLDYITDASGALITDESGLYIDTGTASTSTCLGAVTVYDSSGVVSTFAGDATKLYKLDTVSQWVDVTRASGGDYTTGAGERWQFGFSGGLVLAVTIGDDAQKYLLGSSTKFEALGGTPPQARYIATVGAFTVLGCLLNDERSIHWSGIANPEHWTPGTQSCDTQQFQSGGSVRGIVGGEVGYVFQAETVTRMTFVPDSQTIFQFDQVEGGRGLVAPYSLVRLGADAYYLASDGFYRFSLAGAASTPLGVGKWARAISADIKSGSESTIIGGIDPSARFVLWAYNRSSSTTADLDRVLIYDWTLDEATTADLNVTALAQILTQGVTLDTMDSFGTVDDLPFSLDSPAWTGGASLLGLFGDDARMSFFSGSNMEATIETADGGRPARTLIKGTRPHIDTTAVRVAIAARETEGGTVTYAADEGMEDTGVVSAWCSGFVARARMVVPEAAAWTKVTGMETVLGSAGNR